MKELLFVSRMKVKFQGPNDAIERISLENVQLHTTQYRFKYTLDVLWGQPIKLVEVASTSELLENQRNDLVFFKIIPSHFCRASEASNMDCFKKFGQDFLIPN